MSASTAFLFIFILLNWQPYGTRVETNRYCYDSDSTLPADMCDGPH